MVPPPAYLASMVDWRRCPNRFKILARGKVREVRGAFVCSPADQRASLALFRRMFLFPLFLKKYILDSAPQEAWGADRASI